MFVNCCLRSYKLFEAISGKIFFLPSIVLFYGPQFLQHLDWRILGFRLNLKWTHKKHCRLNTKYCAQIFETKMKYRNDVAKFEENFVIRMKYFGNFSAHFQKIFKI